MFDFPFQRDLVIDSFAGGGGASLGIANALGFHPDIAINHNEMALSMHEANHPDTHHLVSDVHDVDPAQMIAGKKVGMLWASPDCTHFSRARGGRPTKKNIRGLAWVVVKWCKAWGENRPDVIFLENVAEFETWEDYEPWKAALRDLGYELEFRVLKMSDYGIPTIRQRLFMVARRDGKPIVWPEVTHGDPVANSHLKTWKTSADCIDWSNPIPSIFDTSSHIKETLGLQAKRPLGDNTLTRIAKGVNKFVIEEGQRHFISYAQQGGGSRDIRDPMHTICASRKDQNQLISTKAMKVAAFMAQHNTGVIGRPMDWPLATLTGRSTQVNLVSAFMINMRGSALNGAYSAARPLQTLTAQGGHAFAVAAMMNRLIGDVCDDLLIVDVDGDPHVITDICMRSLTPREQFNAQSFTPDYIIDKGHDGRVFTKTEAIHKCGNSVPPDIAKLLVSLNYSC